MKIISDALKAHLAGSVLTTCTCWKITRTDGVVLGFTDHDSDVPYIDVIYRSKTGYTRSAISSDLTLGVDNLEVEGILDSSFIAEQDLRNNVYDHARVDIFLLNWADLTMGVAPLRRGWFGEIIVTPNGIFKTEIRGLMQAMTVNFGETINAKCRASFGDSKCRMPVDPPLWIANTNYPLHAFVKAVISSAALPADPYGGVIFYTSIAGRSGSTIPNFAALAAAPGTPITDGTATWSVGNSFMKQGVVTGATNRKVFTVSGLLHPAGGIYPEVDPTLAIAPSTPSGGPDSVGDGTGNGLSDQSNTGNTDINPGGGVGGTY